MVQIDWATSPCSVASCLVSGRPVPAAMPSESVAGDYRGLIPSPSQGSMAIGFRGLIKWVLLASTGVMGCRQTVYEPRSRLARNERMEVPRCGN